MTPARILVAGIGNIFLGDDAFGVEVVRRLTARSLPHGVEVRDFGIRGLDLAWALQDGYDAVILVDAMSQGGTPGTLRVLEPEAGPPAASLEPHQLDPARVLQLIRAQGGRLPLLRLVGCEPGTFEPGQELSDSVRATVDEAVGVIVAMIGQLRESWQQPGGSGDDGIG
jgi:hydrogenase maturation protease